jgi:penicillin-binding protein 2
VVKLRDSKQGTPYQYRDHALFVAFAPYDKPEVAVAVVVEHGEHGGAAAAPIAGKMLRAYFDSKKPPRTEKGSSSEGDEEEPEESEAASTVKETRINGDATND